MRNLPLLSVKNITFFREYTPIFTGINLNVFPHKMVILRGNNGRGKSTLLKIVSGILPPTSGQVHLSAPHTYLGHGNGSSMSLSVRQSLDCTQSFFKSTITSDQVLDDLQLHAFQNFPLDHLSAGLKRQVALGRVLMSQTNLWILDEPFDHLDQEACHRFCGFFETHLKRGGGIILSTHTSLPFAKEVVQEMWLS